MDYLYTNLPVHKPEDLLSLNVMTQEEKRIYLHKCITPKEMDKIILWHEMKTLRYDGAMMTMEDFVKTAKKILLRYQSKAGGFYFDDIQWKVYTKSSKKYDLYENQIFLENTIHIDYAHNAETTKYLTHLTKIMQSIAKNIKVKLIGYLKERDRIFVYVFQCTRCDA